MIKLGKNHFWNAEELTVENSLYYSFVQGKLISGVVLIRAGGGGRGDLFWKKKMLTVEKRRHWMVQYFSLLENWLIVQKITTVRHYSFCYKMRGRLFDHHSSYTYPLFQISYYTFFIRKEHEPEILHKFENILRTIVLNPNFRGVIYHPRHLYYTVTFFSLTFNIYISNFKLILEILVIVWNHLPK